MRPLASFLFLVAAGCGTVTDSANTPDAAHAPADASDADASAAVDAAPQPDDWSAPEPLFALNGLETREADPSVTPDGLQLFFLRVVPGELRRSLWVATRATTADEWGTPTKLRSGLDWTSIEVAPGGLELYFPRNPKTHVARRSVAGEWEPTMPAAFEPSTGDVTITEDGLTVYHHAAEEPHALVRRTRGSQAEAWSAPSPAGFDYDRPPARDQPAAFYVDIDRRGDTVLLSNPRGALPAVAEMHRLSTGLWSPLRAVPRLAGSAVSCDLVSETEAICEIDSDGDGTGDDLARTVRTLP